MDDWEGAGSPDPTREQVARGFADPPAAYGPIDGWWWEAGRLDRDRLRWQLEELKDKGVCGTWFYARFLYGEPLGSDPGYLSDGWWEFTRFVAEEHRRLGLIDWFSNWTLLQFEQEAMRAQLRDHPRLRGRRLTIHRAEADGAGPVSVSFGPDDEVLDAAAYELSDGSIDQTSRVDLNGAAEGHSLTWTAPGPGRVVEVIAATPWDLAYLGPEVGRRWTDVILGEYERHLPGLLGDVVRAFGPDEMTLLNGTSMYSEEVLERVRIDMGEDPRPLLAGMFRDIGNQTEQLRATYHEAVASLLDERFFQAPTRWLHDRGMLHVTLSQMNDSAISHVFDHVDFFRYLRSFDVPGNEDPMASAPGERRLFQTKVSSSVAHLNGRRRVVLLAHYGSGWGHTPEENVGWTNEAFAKGATLYSRHLASYSLLGGWYEYVPPSDHFYHPYWRYWRTFADYVRRLSFVMSQGCHRPDAAVLYPLTTLHAHWVALADALEPDGTLQQIVVDAEEMKKRVFEPQAVETSQVLHDLMSAVYRGGIDFDLVDDASMNQAELRGSALGIDGVEFRSVVLPPMTTIRRSTMEKIRAFHEAGGAIVALGRLPTASVEGGRDDPALRADLDAVFERGHGVVVTGGASGLVGVLSDLIELDVIASEPMVFHTHQRLTDADVYLVFNASDEARDVTIDVRSEGDPEIWDAFTGEIRPVHRFSHRRGRTAVRLSMGPSQAVILVLQDRPQRTTATSVEEDDLFDVVDVRVVEGEAVRVEALVDGPGSRRAVVNVGGSTVVVKGKADGPPDPIDLDGPLSFRLQPTMENRWGDFRHPRSDALIGAEARTFRYRGEAGTEGTEQGWHDPAFDDGDWREVTYSYGPYWWHIGPFPTGHEPNGLFERVLRDDPMLDREWVVYSKKFGAERPVTYSGDLEGFEHLLGVSDNCLVIDEHGAALSSQDHHHYLTTTVVTPVEATYRLVIGRTRSHPGVSGWDMDEAIPYRVASGTEAWVGREQVLSITEAQASEVSTEIRLGPRANRVVLRLVHPAGTHQPSYAILLDGEPAGREPKVPLLRWFRRSAGPVLDVHPDADEHVGWFRFTAPPGTKGIRFTAHAAGIEAWVDGGPVQVEGGTIELDRPRRQPSSIALRVAQAPGTYAGAVFDEPISFACEEGEVAVGDWSTQGLATYSGIGVYGVDVELTLAHVASTVILDLGRVKAVAELSVNGRPAGVRLGRPYAFDVTDLVREGVNQFEVKVANTLANHMSTYPTRWVLEGQTVSGLLGPVRLRFLSRIQLT